MPTVDFLNRLSIGRTALRHVPAMFLSGRVVDITCNVATVIGMVRLLTVGEHVNLEGPSGETVRGEVIAFHSGKARVLPFGEIDGFGPGIRVLPATNGGTLGVHQSWLGRVIDPLGRPLDRHEPLCQGIIERAIHVAAPQATARARMGGWLDLGIRALDLFAPCRRGQRIGLFAGSGIGKSTLLTMLARHTNCGVVVIALVGERGREVREFIEETLGSSGLSRSVVVVATSDAPPLMRRQAAYTAMTIAEHFRDTGLSVLLLMDSVTRFCHSLREIALAAGESPATRGFPASVFAELPRLLERAGPGLDGSDGHITAIFTVLVDGDDQNEPVADAVRGILDGHVVLDRSIAETGRYPAINVQRSLSRAQRDSETAHTDNFIRRARAIMTLHADMADMVRLGAYKPGTNAAVDEAIDLAPRIEALLCQSPQEGTTMSGSLADLIEIFDQTALYDA